MESRVGYTQVKDIVTWLHYNYIYWAFQYDVACTQGATHFNLSEFDLVKSANATNSHAVKILQSNTRKDIQDRM